MKKYSKMTTERLWALRAIFNGRIEDTLYVARRDGILVNVNKINRLKRKRELVDEVLRKRGVLK